MKIDAQQSQALYHYYWDYTHPLFIFISCIRHRWKFAYQTLTISNSFMELFLYHIRIRTPANHISCDHSIWSLHIMSQPFHHLQFYQQSLILPCIVTWDSSDTYGALSYYYLWRWGTPRSIEYLVILFPDTQFNSIPFHSIEYIYLSESHELL